MEKRCVQLEEVDKDSMQWPLGRGESDSSKGNQCGKRDPSIIRHSSCGRDPSIRQWYEQRSSEQW